MITIGLVTTARSDWGIQRPVAEAIRADRALDLRIIAGGMHLAEEFGRTVSEIRADGFDVAHAVDYLVPGDAPGDLARSMGRGVERFGELFSTWQPDWLTVLGDRFDMLPAALAAAPFLIPVAHLHGGEVTHGAIDDAFRHALTKLSHLHLCATTEYARRIRQLGEADDRIHVVGAPGLDDLLTTEPLPPETLAAEYGFRRGETNALVVYHPETRDYLQAGADAGQIFAALADLDANCVVLRPNADTARRDIDVVIDRFAARHRSTKVAIHLPRRAFLSLMRAASVMVGNSSSGIIEAPSFGLPVVNVGGRQGGRLRGTNVIDCPPDQHAITTGIRQALGDAFRDAAAHQPNPYGDGHSGPRIASILAATETGHTWVRKPFADWPSSGAS